MIFSYIDFQMIFIPKGFAKTAGIPVDMSRIFAKPLCARDRRRLSKKSLNLGYNFFEFFVSFVVKKT